MLENEVAEPAKAEPKVVQKVVPSEEWLKRHLERMACARPVVNEAKGEVKKGDAKQGERGKPPLVIKPKEEAGDEGQALGDGKMQGQGQALGLGDGKPLGLGDGWGW